MENQSIQRKQDQSWDYIFEKKTQGLPDDDRLDLTKSNANEIHKALKARAQNFGDAVNIPVEYNSDGSTKTKNLLTQYHSISLQDVQRRAFGRFSTALGATDSIPTTKPFDLRIIDPASNDDDKGVFYDRVAANIVSTTIKNILTDRGYLELLLSKDEFTFADGDDIEFDGPTMLFLLIQKIDPSTIVGLDVILDSLEEAKLGDHKNDVDQMLTEMESKYNVLKDNDQAPRNILKILFRALKSGQNDTFNKFIQRLEDDVDSGIGPNRNITPDLLISASRTKYNNMLSKKTWDQVHPRDAQLLALATELEDLKKERRTQRQHNFSANVTDAEAKQSGAEDIVPGTSVHKWRAKYDGDTKIVNGKKWFWCRHHKLEGKWNGLYVGHSEDKHKGTKNNTTASSTPKDNTDTTATTSQSQLQLNSRLKQVMCTNLCLSSEDVDKIFEEASSGN